MYSFKPPTLSLSPLMRVTVRLVSSIAFFLFLIVFLAMSIAFMNMNELTPITRHTGAAKAQMRPVR